MVKDILAHIESVRREQILGFAEFIDTREAAPPYLTPNNIWSAANAVLAIKFTQPFGPRAVLVGNLTTFGLVRIFAQIVSGCVPMSVFRDEANAIEWLSTQPRPHPAIQPPRTTKSA